MRLSISITLFSLCLASCKYDALPIKPHLQPALYRDGFKQKETVVQFSYDTKITGEMVYALGKDKTKGMKFPIRYEHHQQETFRDLLTEYMGFKYVRGQSGAKINLTTTDFWVEVFVEDGTSNNMAFKMLIERQALIEAAELHFTATVEKEGKVFQKDFKIRHVQQQDRKNVLKQSQSLGNHVDRINEKAFLALEEWLTEIGL